MTSQLDLAVVRTGHALAGASSLSRARLIIWTRDRDTHAPDGANLPGGVSVGHVWIYMACSLCCRGVVSHAWLVVGFAPLASTT